jgi:outer membrane protein assembly factor BamD
MAKEKYADAIKDLEALESRYPYGEHSTDAQLALIKAYYKRSEYALALSAVDRFIRMNPRHPEADYAHYLKGMISFDQNTTMMYRHLPIDRSLRDSTPAHQSFAAFKELVELFPESKYAVEARQRMLALRDQLANHELNAVQYYMKRGAYLSAVNRANYIVQNYSQTQAVPEALCSMVISYRKLGMAQLSADAESVLKTNFPTQSVPKK